MSVQALAVGAATGFFGAIPPGPASMAVADHAASGRARRAISVGLGAALVDFLLCASISTGAGPTIARLTHPSWVRAALAIAYATVGMVMIAHSLRARRRGAPPTKESSVGFAGGMLRGIANPSLFANWTLVIAGLGASGLLPQGPLAGLAFALGVGLGVSGWFSALARIVDRVRGARFSSWLRISGLTVGALLLAGGAVATFRALAS
jgi:threonine/homoserine/homoserine lactone efflux protein